MKSHDEWMAETMQPILDRIGGPMTPDEERETRARIEQMTGPAFRTVFNACKDADNLPPNCDGCRENLAGDPICCLGDDAE